MQWVFKLATVDLQHKLRTVDRVMKCWVTKTVQKEYSRRHSRRWSSQCSFLHFALQYAAMVQRAHLNIARYLHPLRSQIRLLSTVSRVNLNFIINQQCNVNCSRVHTDRHQWQGDMELQSIVARSPCVSINSQSNQPHTPHNSNDIDRLFFSPLVYSVALCVGVSFSSTVYRPLPNIICSLLSSPNSSVIDCSAINQLFHSGFTLFFFYLFVYVSPLCVTQCLLLNCCQFNGPLWVKMYRVTPFRVHQYSLINRTWRLYASLYLSGSGLMHSMCLFRSRSVILSSSSENSASRAAGRDKWN